MTKIEWTNESWNPIVGCSLASPGCTNCYAMADAHRRLDGVMRDGRLIAPHYLGTTTAVNGKAVWTGKIGIAGDYGFLKPMRWTRPRMVFVNSMSDLFHPDIPIEVIDRVFAVMALCPQHTFQVLTKRSARMRAYLSESDWQWAARARQALRSVAQTTLEIVGAREELDGIRNLRRPLRNVWLGVSAEDQKRADERIPDLLATPAAVRFVSAEPLLGPVDFGRYLWEPDLPQKRPCGLLQWIIVGGESGPAARPMAVQWARNIVRQCKDAGVAVFVKQLGARPVDDDGAPWAGVRHRKGAQMAEWPADLRVREMPLERREVAA